MALPFLRISCLLTVLLAFGFQLSAQIPNNYVTQQTDLPCLNKRLSLRVHLVDDVTGPLPFDTARFEEVVEYTNTLFAPICLSFEACEYLRVENYRYATYERSDGEEQTSIYGDPNRIDVYYIVADSMDLKCGLASLNGVQSDQTSYVMVVGKCLTPQSSVLAHELGHYFGLEHTFERSHGLELVDGSNCAEAGDRICDTPADPYIHNVPIRWLSGGCRFAWPGQDANGQFYVPHVGNVMSYYPCTCGFTHDQHLVMANNYLRSPRRLW